MFRLIPHTRSASRGYLPHVPLVCGLALLLSACASSSPNDVIDSMPSSIGGLTADTPARPADPPAYPAVHDMPPPPPNTTLSAEEQIQLENQMTAIKTRQDVITGAPPAKRTTTPAAPPRIGPAASSSNSIY